MTYFKNINDLEELRKQYKELLKKFHPDNGGDLETMKVINVEYDNLFKILKNKHTKTTAEHTDSKTDYNNMKYDFSEDALLREMLNKVIALSDITIEVCGSWLWIFGNTYQHKELLKEYGFKYASKKRSWYWHSEVYRKKSHKSLSMDDIRNYYGSTEVKTEIQKQLKQA